MLAGAAMMATHRFAILRKDCRAAVHPQAIFRESGANEPWKLIKKFKDLQGLPARPRASSATRAFSAAWTT